MIDGMPALGEQPKVGDKLRKKYPFKKSINLWAFPYPEKMTLEQCLQLAKDAGFDGIELNYDLDSDLSPKSGPKEFAAIRRTAEKIGIAISGMCSFLFWPYPLTSNDPAKPSVTLGITTPLSTAVDPGFSLKSKFFASYSFSDDADRTCAVERSFA